ncbi:MAG: hypothetical protein M3O41_15840 [Pseudomonadota bacterium]|nr:hypothetical protein [Pseudomonadota bacterium]
MIDTLLSDSSVTLDRHRLARQARQVLYARHCLVPGEGDIEDWVGARVIWWSCRIGDT